jgi:hypothetical protein
MLVVHGARSCANRMSFRGSVVYLMLYARLPVQLVSETVLSACVSAYVT